MSFRERLREEISFKGFQKKEFAAKVDISYSTFLSYIDKREIIPPADITVRIAQVLGVSVEYLVTGKETKYSPKKEFFYDKYSKFESLLIEFDKLSNDTYLQSEPALMAMVKGLQCSDSEKKKGVV